MYKWYKEIVCLNVLLLTSNGKTRTLHQKLQYDVTPRWWVIHCSPEHLSGFTAPFRCYIYDFQCRRIWPRPSVFWGEHSVCGIVQFAEKLKEEVCSAYLRRVNNRVAYIIWHLLAIVCCSYCSWLLHLSPLMHNCILFTCVAMQCCLYNTLKAKQK